MTSTQPNGVELKTDPRGRVVTPVARRESWLDEFERSGLSGAKFAQLTGLKYSTFACWLQRRRQERGAAPASGQKDPAAAVRWLEAVVEQASPGPGPESVRVRLSSGA